MSADRSELWAGPTTATAEGGDADTLTSKAPDTAATADTIACRDASADLAMAKAIIDSLEVTDAASEAVFAHIGTASGANGKKMVFDSQAGDVGFNAGTIEYRAGGVPMFAYAPVATQVALTLASGFSSFLIAAPGASNILDLRTNDANGQLRICSSNIRVHDHALNAGGRIVPTSGKVAIQDTAGTERFAWDGTGIGFHAATPVAQPADPGLLVDSIAGSIALTLAAIPDPADTPATADALRDDLVTNTIPAIRDALSSIADVVKKLRNVLSAAGGGNGLSA